MVAAHFKLAKKRELQPAFVARQKVPSTAPNEAKPNSLSQLPTSLAPLAEELVESHANETQIKRVVFQWDSSKEIE